MLILYVGVRMSILGDGGAGEKATEADGGEGVVIESVPQGLIGLASGQRKKQPSR